MKATHSGLYRLPVMSRFARSADLEGCVKASNMVVFHDTCFKERSLLGPQCFEI